MFRKNVAGQVIHFQGVDSATGGVKSGVTWTVRRCIDGTFAAGGGTVTEDGTTGWYKYAMSQADTNGNNIGFNFTGTGAIPQTVNIITTAADPTDAVRLGLTALPNAAAEAAGGLYTRGTGAGQINQPADGMVDANTVRLGGTTQTGRDIGASVLLAADQAVNATKFGGTTVTGRDIGASVLLSSGTGAGQLDFTSGVVKANLAQILGTALTETAGQIAAAFKKFFDKASPTGTINSIPDAVAGAASGLALVGSDVGAATSVSGSVGSVTAGVTVSTNNDKTGYGLSSAAVQAIWDALTSVLTTTGSIGKRIVDFLTGDIFARLGAPTGASISEDILGIRTRIPSSLTANGNIKSSLQEILSTALTGGGTGEGFEHFFNVASPTGTVNSLPNAVPGAAGGLLTDDVWTDARAAKLDNLDTTVSSRGTGTALDAAEVRSAVGLAAADLDDQLEEISNKAGDAPTRDEIASSVRATMFTDRFGSTPAPSNILFAEAGGASTEGLELYKAIGGTPTIDTSIKPPTAYSSIKCDIGQWVRATCLGSGKISIYFFAESLPTTNQTFLLPEDDSGSPDPVIDIRIGPDGLVYWHPVDASPEIPGTHPISIGWNRVSVCFNHHGTINNLDAKVYVNGALDISIAGQGTNDILIGQFRLLGPNTDGGPFYFAHVVVEDGADLIDPGNRLCTAKFSTTVNEDEFDTTGGSGAVNERPIDDANYREQAGSSVARQNYNLQSVSEGDVDITGADIVGFMGWLRGKKSSPLGGGTAKITLDGADFNIALTTSASVLTKPVTQSSYPSSPAAIGMVSTGSTTDTTLYECGIVIVYTPPFIPTKEAIADGVWDEDIVAAHQTADTAGKKLSQALILYEGS